MEYIVGSIVTAILIRIATVLVSRASKKFKMPGLKYSQSHIYSLVKPIAQLKSIIEYKPEATQSRRHNESTRLRILYDANEAYWISENALFVADMVDGSVDESSTRKVDTIGMDKVQLDKTIFIVEKLTEGLLNDSGNSGNSWL